MAQRVTSHSARSHNGAVFTAKHTDRCFDVSRAPHIDGARTAQNIYWRSESWGVFQTNEEVERAAYAALFSDYVADKNARAVAARHAERCITTEDLRKGARTCPEETLLYFGDKDANIPPDTFRAMCAAYVSWYHSTFPAVKILDVALHFDEQGAPHAHMRTVYVGDHNGLACPSQTSAFAIMGIENHRQRYDNAKVTMSKMCRSRMMEIARAYGYEIEETPRSSRAGLDLLDYKAAHAREQVEEQDRRIIPDEDRATWEALFRPSMRRGFSLIADEDRERIVAAAAGYTHERDISAQTQTARQRDADAHHTENICHALSLREMQKTIDDMNASRSVRDAFLLDFLQWYGLDGVFIDAWHNRNNRDNNRDIEMNRRSHIDEEIDL